jgi:NADPH2:quinone reductase
MRVIEITAFGPPERLAVRERPVPVPSSEEVLVEVAGAGVNRADVMQRRGHYPPPQGASDLLGLEVSGTVAAIGNGVTRWQIGDRVCGLVTGGGYAEYCVIPAPLCLPVPADVELVDAAALPEACMTVWTNVFDHGRLQAGECFLVHGGSSGIGTTAIQLARLWGAEVFATAGTAEKCAACERLGATQAFNYRETDFAEALRVATDGRGVDVILDMVGGAYLRSNLESLAVEGRLVLIGLMRGATAEIDLAALMSRRLVLTGSTLRSCSIRRKAAIADSVRAQVWPWVADARFKPVVYERFSLDLAAEAHRTMEASVHIGKLLLQP